MIATPSAWICSPTRNTACRLWDAKTGKECAVFNRAIIAENSVAFSPDGKWLAWAGTNTKVHVCTVIGGEEVFTHTAEADPETRGPPGSRVELPVPAMDFSTDSKLLAVGTNRVIQLFDVAAGKLLKTLGHEPKDGQPAIRDGYRVHFSPDGKTLGSISGAGISLWDVPSGKLNRSLSGYGSQAPHDLTFYRDGKKLASRAGDGAVHFWDVTTGKEEQEAGHQCPVGLVALSPDGKVVVTSSLDSVRFWDRATGKEVRQLPKVPITALAYGPDGLVMIGAAKDGLFHLYDPDTGKDKGKLGQDLWKDHPTAVSADGKLFAEGTHEIRVVELPSGKEKAKLAGHGVSTACLAFGPDGKTLVSAGMDASDPKQIYGVKLWDLATGKELRTLQQGSLYAVSYLACSPDGRYVMTNLHTYDFGVPPIKDLAKGKVTEGPVIYYPYPGYPGYLAVFSPDGKLLAVATERSETQFKTEFWIDLFDTTTWENVAVLKGHTQGITALAFSADGKFLVSGSMDTSARVWNVPERKK